MDEWYYVENDPEEMHNIVDSSAHSAAVDDMQARLYELMNRYADPYGDLPQPGGKHLGGRYCAPRYLARGKRL